jgi:galactokinase
LTQAPIAAPYTQLRDMPNFMLHDSAPVVVLMKIKGKETGKVNAADRAIDLKQKFRRSYGRDARVYRAPGRVNLIGEHTDYNDGFVMPAPIGFSTWIALAPRDDRKLSIYSENFCERVEFDISVIDGSGARPRPAAHWSDYVCGVAVALEQAGYPLRGGDMIIRGEVPIGSGLSSSAALEVAVGYALLDASDHTVDRVELAKLCQRAENEYVGMRCGIMDQFISCCGHAGRALLLDCRSLDYRSLPLPGVARLVVCNTMVKHELASGEYNRRRAECEDGVERLARFLPDARALRDVTPDELERHGRELPEVVYRRCRHVIGENARVMAAAAALEQNDLAAFGRLMSESHRSLSDDYQVSCDELNLLVELAGRVEGVYGARMMGGGFGGCVISLVAAESVAEFERVVAQGYQQAAGRAPEIYVCDTAEGVERL